VKVSADTVHFIDKGDAGNPVLVRLMPDGFGLRLYPAHRAENHHRAVEHSQGALHFDGKIHMSRCINDMNISVGPQAGGRRRGDGYAPFLLLHQIIHNRLPVVDFTHFVNFAGIK